jgi:glyoxylase-like metal-dependent hydrolase (beta-lactamase superfamily II)
MWGWPEPSVGEPVADGATIATEHRSFQVVYTPGHSPDHVCLYEPDAGWLFTGDLYVGGRDRALRADYDAWEIIESLKKIAALPATVLFPGSARVREDPTATLQAKIRYLEELGEQVLELHRRGRSVRRIAGTLCGGPMLMELLTLGHFSRRNLVLSFLGKFQQPVILRQSAGGPGPG